MVPIRAGAIRLEEAYATLVATVPGSLSDTKSIETHHILPSETHSAPAPAGVLDEIGRRLDSNVLLVHHARIDLRFLKHAYAREGKRWPRPPVVDTVRLLWRWASRQRLVGTDRGEPALNLAEARGELGLPPYPAHDALTDAVATAELMLVLRARLGVRELSELF
jgi:DNA polymerase-3 subunit epsilon